MKLRPQRVLANIGKAHTVLYSRVESIHRGVRACLGAKSFASILACCCAARPVSGIYADVRHVSHRDTRQNYRHHQIFSYNIYDLQLHLTRWKTCVFWGTGVKACHAQRPDFYTLFDVNSFEVATYAWRRCDQLPSRSLHNTPAHQECTTQRCLSTFFSQFEPSASPALAPRYYQSSLVLSSLERSYPADPHLS